MELRKSVILSIEGNDKDLNNFFSYIKSLKEIECGKISEDIISINNVNVKNNFFHILGKTDVDFYITSTKLSYIEKLYLDSNKELYSFILEKLNALVDYIKTNIKEGSFESFYKDFITLKMLKPLYKTKKEFQVVKDICFKILENFGQYNNYFLNNNFYESMYVYSNYVYDDENDFYCKETEEPKKYSINIDLCKNK